MDRVNQKFKYSSRPTQDRAGQQLRKRNFKASPIDRDFVTFKNFLICVERGHKKISDDPGNSPSGQSRVPLNQINRIDNYRIFARDSFTCAPRTKSTPDTIDFHVMSEHLSAIKEIVATHEHFPGNFGKAPSVQEFTRQTVRWLQHANRAYAERKSVMTTYYFDVNELDQLRPKTIKKKFGVFYPDSYLAHEFPSLSKCRYLYLHSLPKYFDHTYKNSFVGNDNGRSPSECLSAFFHGPTISDCATTLLACQYRAIETIIGTDEFNHIFAAPASKFRIARSLFIHSISPTECLPVEFGDLQPINLVNPLISLFDDFRSSFSSPVCSDLIANKPSEADVKEGDTLYIGGVDRYIKRHKSGDGIGFNLICTGQNSSRQNLYLGFDPDLFDQPKTYDQVKKILIDRYNRPQGPDTIAAIDRGESGYAQLTNDTLSYDHPIVGITGILRFNPSRWERSALQRDKAWHRQPLMPVAQALAPVPLDNGSPFTVENADSDFDRFETFSSQQKSMKITALKFTHAVIDGTVEPSHKKPMGLFLIGMPGVGKTHLCVAVAKKAAEHGVKTLYIDANTVYDPAHDTTTAQWHCDIDIMLAGKDLVVLDDINSKNGYSQLFLAQTMQRVLTENIAIMASSNNRILVKNATPGFLDPLDERAHNFLTLSDLLGDSRRTQWWQCPEVQATDELSRLGQYKGSKAAGIITEQPVSIDDIARALNISADQIRRVGRPFLPEIQKVSSDLHCQDLSRTQHRAVVLEYFETDDNSLRLGEFEIRQFLYIIQRVHDEGLKLIIKTSNSSLFIEKVRGYLDTDIFIESKRDRIVERLNHMFHKFLLGAQQ